MTSYRVYFIERLPVLLGRLDAGRRLDGSLQQARPHAQARDLLLFDELRQVVGKLPNRRVTVGGCHGELRARVDVTETHTCATRRSMGARKAPYVKSRIIYETSGCR